MRIFIALILCFFSVLSLADLQIKPTQPMRKLQPIPPADFSVCQTSRSVCLTSADFNVTSAELFDTYCYLDDEYITKLAASVTCKTPTPKQINCARCQCPSGFLRDPATHLCIPEQYCDYGIRNYINGDCWPATCPYGDCANPAEVEHCVESENAVLIGTPDPLQDECVCPQGSTWSTSQFTCVTCPPDQEFDDYAGQCRVKNCDIKLPPDAPPDYDQSALVAACYARHIRSWDSLWTSAYFVHGYCWSPHELMTTFCNEVYQDCKFYLLNDHPELSDQKRQEVCKEPPKPKSSTPNSSAPSSHAASSQPSSMQNSVASASISASFSSINASQNSSQSSANISTNSFGSLSSQTQVNISSQGSQTSQGNGNNNNQSSAGKGDCDPTASNYSDCISPNRKPLPEHSKAESGAKSFGEVNQAFLNRISNSPMINSFQKFKNIVNIDNAECPIFEIDLSETIIGQKVSTTIHCDLMLQFVSMFNIITIIGWSFLAFRIFASS